MQLKRIVDALKPEFEDRVAFVLADLTTREGNAFALRYGAGHTTLVFLEASGRSVGTLQGVQSEDYLHAYIRRAFGPFR